MRRAVILLLLVWLVVGGLSSLALADRPGWIPGEFKRGGGDELESVARFDPNGTESDGVDCGMAPAHADILAEPELEARSGSETVTLLPTKTKAIVWWVYSVLWRW